MLAQSRAAHAAHFLPALQSPRRRRAACARLGAGRGAAALRSTAVAAAAVAAAAAATAARRRRRKLRRRRRRAGGGGASGWAGGGGARSWRRRCARCGPTGACCGSALLRTAHAQSDVDLCAIVPQHARAHPRDVRGRAQLLPLLQAAEEQLRGCPQVSSLELLAESKTPLLSFACDTGSGGVAAVELTFNNSDALANSYVYGALLARAPPLRLSCRFVRVWARRQKLCGPQGTPSAWTWSVLAAYAAQHRASSPWSRPTRIASRHH